MILYFAKISLRIEKLETDNNSNDNNKNWSFSTRSFRGFLKESKSGKNFYSKAAVTIAHMWKRGSE
jgi:hypothetical protein